MAGMVVLVPSPKAQVLRPKTTTARCRLRDDGGRLSVEDVRLPTSAVGCRMPYALGIVGG